MAEVQVAQVAPGIRSSWIDPYSVTPEDFLVGPEALVGGDVGGGEETLEAVVVVLEVEEKRAELVLVCCC